MLLRSFFASGGGRSWPAALLSLLLLAQPWAALAAAPATGAPAPNFVLRTLDGQNLRLSEQRGQVVMLNFWATWCGPCREEMPQLNRLHDKYKGAGFALLGINVDEDPRQAAALAAKLGVKFPVLLDSDKQISKTYDLSAMPSTVLIDRDGKVRHVHRGYRDGVADLYDQQIRQMLKE
ncbi:TlpA disulfide reductase family protein [Ideonella sp.]|uniref:TlpA disulfide reductase family protein n=1 Tax=Ideonella sp. TaxID=1929293 RepID=UPI003BB7F550